MKKTIITVIIAIFLALLIILITPKDEKFYLEDKYYGSPSQTEISLKKLNKLIKNKESFALFVYQPACVTSANFSEILNTFQQKTQISFYKIPFAKIKKDKTYNYLKYYPSFIIFKNGKMISYLDANQDKDVKYYENEKDFQNWFKTYVKIKKTKTKKAITKEETKIKTTNIKLNNVTKEENKTNIYFFWGDGCPHCEEEKQYFKNLKQDYGNYYNLYTFEVWYNEDNQKILNAFANAMNEEVKGVPYTIIGNKSFIGFNDETKKQIKKAIKENQKKNYDVYYDKISK